MCRASTFCLSCCIVDVFVLPPVPSISTSEALEMGQTQTNDPESFGILFHCSFRPCPALAYMSLRYIYPGCWYVKLTVM